MHDKSEKIDSILNILYGLAILAIYFWLISGPTLQGVIDEYLIITQEKITTKGQIIQADEFEDEIESNESRTMEIVNGYSYTYSFLTSDGRKIERLSGNYGELPLDKNLKDIPYDVEIEYVSKSPEINRIKGLWSNNTDLFQWFWQKVLFKFIVFIICLVISFLFIKGGVNSCLKSNN
ncbi:hypothetical protein [Arenibacter certesii]|uniref:Uncharacterized protein n=1 Tax=Arenibacter certesii TaxID=228955 RepID=A0A918IXD2_9FLAO|nr:hypothetical protein [Arenibacter certesii]GGW37308.1 hypothetical protein GCM10007383_22710 [Arenibacter certesii]